MDRRIGALGTPKILSSLSNTTIVKFTDPNHPDGADSKGAAADYCRGFHINADGTLYVNYPEALTVNVPLVVKEGSYYPYSIARFRATSTSITAAQIIPMR